MLISGNDSVGGQALPTGCLLIDIVYSHAISAKKTFVMSHIPVSGVDSVGAN